MRFKIEAEKLHALAKQFKHSQSAWAFAAGNTINDLAFDLKRQAPATLAKVMVIRNPRFVSSRFRVTKSRRSKPISGQKALMGSVAKSRFTGWREQSEGMATPRKRTIALLARRGSILRQAAPKARLKPGNRIMTRGDVRGSGDRSRELRLIQMLKRQRSKVPFILSKTWRKGLYRIEKGRVRLLQAFEKKQPRRIPWLVLTVGDALSARGVKKTFTKNLVLALRNRKRLAR